MGTATLASRPGSRNSGVGRGEALPSAQYGAAAARDPGPRSARRLTPSAARTLVQRHHRGSTQGTIPVRAIAGLYASLGPSPGADRIEGLKHSDLDLVSATPRAGQSPHPAHSARGQLLFCQISTNMRDTAPHRVAPSYAEALNAFLRGDTEEELPEAAAKKARSN
jgi:hypothetical protein